MLPAISSLWHVAFTIVLYGPISTEQAAHDKGIALVQAHGPMHQLSDNKHPIYLVLHFSSTDILNTTGKNDQTENDKCAAFHK